MVSIIQDYSQDAETCLKQLEESIRRLRSNAITYFKRIDQHHQDLQQKVIDVDQDEPEWFKSAIDEASMDGVLIQQLYRQIVSFNKESKETIASIKQDVTKKHLNLQNIKYEKLYISREIQKCEQTHTIYEDISLMSIESFKSSSFFKEGSIDHEQMILRLKHELHQRINLENQRKELETQRDKLKKEVAKEQSDLENLDKDIETYIQSSIALQKKLGLNITEKILLDRASKQLSNPLKLLYQLFKEHGEKNEKSVRIDIQEEVDTGETTEQEGNDSKINVDQEGINNNTSVDNKVDSNSGRSASPTRTRREAKVSLEKHPFHLLMSVLQSDGKTLFKLKFSYVKVMNLVAIKPIFKEGTSRHIHCAQLLSDISIGSIHANTNTTVGSGSTSTTSRVLSKKGDLFAFSWLQSLCGLLKDSSLEKFVVGEILEKTTARWEAIRKFDKYIDQMLKGNSPTSLTKSGITVKDVKLDEKVDGASNLDLNVTFIRKSEPVKTKISIPYAYPKKSCKFEFIQDTTNIIYEKPMDQIDVDSDNPFEDQILSALSFYENQGNQMEVDSGNVDETKPK